MKRYRYIGSGAGVPGLPHQVSQAEIEKFNEEQAHVWHEALSYGLYEEIEIEPRSVGGKLPDNTVLYDLDGVETITPSPRKKTKKSARSDKGE